jgi:hypothetical protein
MMGFVGPNLLVFVVGLGIAVRGAGTARSGRLQ